MTDGVVWSSPSVLTRRLLLTALAAGHASVGSAMPAQKSRESCVFFHAASEDSRVNALIAWAGERMRMEYGLRVRHIRASGAAPVDLLCLSGAELASLAVPHRMFLPLRGTVAVPWRRRHVVIVSDAARTETPPRSMAALLDWALRNPGRVAHAPADAPLLLAQALAELAPQRATVAQPAADAAYAAQSAPMWDWYARLHPHLFRHGGGPIRDSLALAALLRDGELDLYVATNPGEAAYGIAHGLLPRTACACVPEAGPVGDSAFLMALRDAVRPEAAMLLANFLLSPEAQAHAQKPAILGCPTVLAPDRLPPAPHPTWLARITADWSRRVTR